MTHQQGGARAAAKPVRGQPIDIGGRRLRAVIAGPAGPRPTVVLEHGAFGCSADWAEVQERLAAKGWPLDDPRDAEDLP